MRREGRRGRRGKGGQKDAQKQRKRELISQKGQERDGAARSCGPVLRVQGCASGGSRDKSAGLPLCAHIHRRGTCAKRALQRSCVRACDMETLTVLLAAFSQGSTSLTYARLFQEKLDDYCIAECTTNGQFADAPNPVGCVCESDVTSSHTSLPTVVFVSPAIGLIVIGVFSLIASMVGCLGAIRQRALLIYGYCCILFIVIIMQFSFGGAAGAIASGRAPEITGPLEGTIRSQYRQFQWNLLSAFFPEECYQGQAVYTFEKKQGGLEEYRYYFPLCDFDGCYRGKKSDRNPGAQPTEEEQKCCTADFKCDVSKPQCRTAASCLDSFFARAGGPVFFTHVLTRVHFLTHTDVTTDTDARFPTHGPTHACILDFADTRMTHCNTEQVATMCFLPIFLEILCIVFACLIRKGPPGGTGKAEGEHRPGLPFPSSTV